MLKLFRRKLTDESIASLKRMCDAIEMSTQINDVIAALNHADLLKYHTREAMKQRFGSRMVKDSLLSYILGVINGMANKIDTLNAKVKQFESNQNQPSA